MSAEPCRACGAALAEDQRYCLNCGERRGAPRVEFRRYLEAPGGEQGPPRDGATAAPGSPPPEPEGAGGGGRRQRDYAPLAAAGGIAVLGVMLLIGVLIGRGTGESSGSAAQPQVVTVAAESAGDEAAGSEADKGAEGAGKQKPGGGKQQAKQKKGKGGAVGGGSGNTGNATVASEDQLKELQEQSPEEYSESSAKLPDEIATPGKPPPTDGKAPGGGSGGTTLE